MEPSVRPLMNCFCSAKNTISVGIATMIDAGRDQVVVHEELALQVVQGGRDRQLGPRLHQHQGPEEVVVDPRDLERREGGERGPRERQDDAPVGPPHARAVHDGGLVELLGQRLHVVAQHERTEAQLEGDVDRDDPEVLVVEEPVVAQDRRQRQEQEHPEERRDDDLRREQVRRGEHHEQRRLKPPAVARDGERHHRGEEQHEDHGRDQDDDRVEEVLRESPCVQACGVVVQVVRAADRHVTARVACRVLVRPEATCRRPTGAGTARRCPS